MKTRRLAPGLVFLLISAAFAWAADRSIPLLDRNGHTIAWIRDDAIVNMQGKPVLTIKDDTVHGRNGPVGHFVEGIIRDLEGRAVAFVAGANGKGLSLPAPKTSRAEPPASGLSGPSATRNRWPAAPRAEWSKLSWEAFSGQ